MLPKGTGDQIQLPLISVFPDSFCLYTYDTSENNNIAENMLKSKSSKSNWNLVSKTHLKTTWVTCRYRVLHLHGFSDWGYNLQVACRQSSLLLAKKFRFVTATWIWHAILTCQNLQSGKDKSVDLRRKTGFICWSLLEIAEIRLKGHLKSLTWLSESMWLS